MALFIGVDPICILLASILVNEILPVADNSTSVLPPRESVNVIFVVPTGTSRVYPPPGAIHFKLPLKEDKTWPVIPILLFVSFIPLVGNHISASVLTVVALDTKKGELTNLLPSYLGIRLVLTFCVLDMYVANVLTFQFTVVLLSSTVPGIKSSALIKGLNG